MGGTSGRNGCGLQEPRPMLRFLLVIGLSIEAYGRPAPSPYDAPPPQPTATLREKFKL